MPKPCPTCGSTRWRKDRVTGNAVCEDGHVFQDFRSENLVVEAVSHTLQKRTIRRGPRRNKRREEGLANKDYYHGDDAEYLKLQAIQLLLRYQVQALSKLWNLPEAFESIVRDLWAYQLAEVQLPPRPSVRPREITPSEIDGGATKRREGSKQAVNEEDEEEPGEEGSGTETDEGVDPEILAALSESSLSSLGGLARRSKSKGKEKPAKRKKRIRIADTLVVLIVGCWVLRIPVLQVEMQSLVNRNEIPFIDYGRTTLMPEEMRKHLNRDVTLALCPGRAPSAMSMHQVCHTFAQKITQQYGLTIPEANISPIAWKVVSSLGGTPTTYSQVFNLMRLLDVNLSLVNTGSVLVKRRVPINRSRSKRRDTLPRSLPGSETEDVDSDGAFKDQEYQEYRKAKHYADIWMPELSVVGVWVMVMKMAYGLDGRERVALTSSDPVIGAPDGNMWVEELSKRLDEGSMRRDGLEGMAQRDFTSMDLDDIDTYLDQCQYILLKDREFPSDTSPFPLDETNNHRHPATTPSWAAYHQNMSRTTVQMSKLSADVPNRDLPLLPGEKVRSYKADEAALPSSYEVVNQAAAEVVGVEFRDVMKVVETYERKLEKVRKARGAKSRSASRGRLSREVLSKRRSLGSLIAQK